MKHISILRAILLATLACTSVTGCGGSKLEVVQVDPYELGANHRNMRINGIGYSGEQYTEKMNADFKTTYVIEDVKALVVPVDFIDVPITTYGTDEHVHDILKAAVFGTREENAWYSLKEYYASSSFGQCNITGTVLPTWHWNDTVANINKNKKDTGLAARIAVKIQDYYREHPITLEDGSEVNLSHFDSNQDGLIDSIIMIYSAPITTTGEIWWAFCSSVSGAYGKYTRTGNLEGANRFFWASMKFLFEKGGSGEDAYYSNEEIAAGTVKPDAHTLTHEYGHVLSLPDYYVTDYNGSDYSAMGALDMMDYNIGDHNAFSKMLYGWINPKRVAGTSGKVTVELKSTTKTGDTIIIPAPGEWNNTYLDQYLMVEFLTPEGVAEQDGKAKYLGKYPLYYSKAGVRITHVDARMGLRTYSSGKWQFSGYTWTTTPPEKNSSYISFAADNTASDSCFPDYKLIEVVPANGKTQKQRGGAAADDSCLYYQGDVFGTKGIHDKFMFNGIDGTKNVKFGFKISVDKIDGNESATITISR